MRNGSLLALMLLVALSIGALIGLPSPPSAAPMAEVQPLVAGLDAVAVTAVEVRLPGQQSIRVVRQGSGWMMPAQRNYKAAGQAVDRLLADLSGARLVEPKTRDPANFARLKLASQGEGAATQVIVERPGTPSLSVLLGKSVRQSGQLVRRQGEDQVWLMDTLPRLPARALDWLDRRIARLPATSVAGLKIRHTSGEEIELRRDGFYQPLRMHSQDGMQALSEQQIAAMAGWLEHLDFQALGGLDSSLPSLLDVQWTTLEGGVLRAHFQVRDEQPWLIIDEVRGMASDQVFARSGWAYRVDPEAFLALAQRLNRLPEPKPLAKPKPKPRSVVR